MDKDSTSKAEPQTGVVRMPVVATPASVTYAIPFPRLLMLAGILFVLIALALYLTQTTPRPFSVRAANTISPGSSDKYGRAAGAAQSPTTANTSISSANDSNATNQKTTVIINGQTVPLPTSGQIHKTLTTENGTTTVDYSASSSTSGSSNNSNTSISVQSNSSSDDPSP